jgi:MOSC domain-containing protein YiiM/catechol 2,3-dioxygenase-like lactoylglutathione lyase family enzyme
MSTGTIHRIHVSKGGVPKLPVQSVRVSKSGLEGDAHAKPDIHGGPHQAVCLFALERIEALAREGHPISPGSVGENVTVQGLDWDGIHPGARLSLGAEVRIEITGYAAPCRTIAGSFSDGRFNRLSQIQAPGWSRLYAEVLREGEIRTGDPITLEASERTGAAVTGSTGSSSTSHTSESMASGRETGANDMQLAYVNVYVTNLERSVEFFQKTLGLGLQFAETNFGYASFDAGPVRMGLAQIDAADEVSRALVGRQTGVGFGVRDLVASHARLEASGVEFPMKPAKQPWGGFMAMFADPDRNVFYLDEIDDG